MLKQLLGQWKAHKRKPPSLLPEETEIIPDDPSKINPIYEDSEESNSPIPPDSLTTPIDTPERARKNPTNSNNDSVDSPIPVSSSQRDYSKSTDEEDPEDVINQIDIAVNSSLSAEDRAAYEVENKSSPETVNKPSSETEDDKKIQESTSHEIASSSVDNVFEVNDQIGDVPDNSLNPKIVEERNKGNVESHSKSSKEAINEAIKQLQASKLGFIDKQPKNLSASEAIAKKGGVVSPDENKPVQRPLNKTEVPANSNMNLESNKNMSSSQNVNLDQKLETHVKTRAIDELIRKFQGHNAESDPSLKTVASFLHSPQRKSILKPVASKSNKESDTQNSNNVQAKESLAKIFTFPPPPPLDSLKNKKPEGNNQKVEKVTASELSRADNNVSSEKGKTRSDSSLSRNKTVASNDISETEVLPTKLLTRKQSVNRSNSVAKSHESQQSSNLAPSESISAKKDSNTQLHKQSTSNKIESSKDKVSLTNQTEAEKEDNKNENSLPETSFLFQRKESFTSNNSSKRKIENIVSTTKKHDEKLPQSSSAAPKHEKLFTSRMSSDADPPQKESEAIKSPSEDSGITRGDQASSETSPDVAAPETTKSTDPESSSLPKSNMKEKKRHSRSKVCKHCRRKENEGAPITAGHYYDLLTGGHHSHHRKHSSSCASDLSWEEAELFKRHHKRRDTLRSNAPSNKSGHSRLSDKPFRRHQPLRRSLSEENVYNSPHMCTCDYCWMFLVKDYAYNRTSLRGKAQNQVLCTCQTGRPDFLGRRVKFHSDAVPQASTAENTLTPTIPEEPTENKEDAMETKSNTSSATQDAKSPKSKGEKRVTNPDKLKDNYRLVTPWEFEAWDLERRRDLLKKRRRRARYMAFMALAMVVFVGLVVTILMVYLRRKTI